MARKVGQIVGRKRRTWLVRVYNGHDPETKKRKYLNQTIHGGRRDAQAHLNKMLGERDRGRNLDSSRQTLNEFMDRWPATDAMRFSTLINGATLRHSCSHLPVTCAKTNI